MPPHAIPRTPRYLVDPRSTHRERHGPLVTPCCRPRFCYTGDHRLHTDGFHHGRSRRQPPRYADPYGNDDPFPVHHTTEQVAYSLHPAIFVPE